MAHCNSGDGNIKIINDFVTALKVSLYFTIFF